MNTFSILALSFSLSALIFSMKNHERINKLEKKLKEFDLIPGEVSSEATPEKSQSPAD